MWSKLVLVLIAVQAVLPCDRALLDFSVRSDSIVRSARLCAIGVIVGNVADRPTSGWRRDRLDILFVSMLSSQERLVMGPIPSQMAFTFELTKLQDGLQDHNG